MLELTKVFSQDEFDRALASWEWIDLEGKTPVFASLFGDVIFKAGSDYWFLDTLEGSLSREWTGEEALQASLQTDEGQDQYLLGGLVQPGSGLDLCSSRGSSALLPAPFETDPNFTQRGISASTNATMINPAITAIHQTPITRQSKDRRHEPQT